MDLAREVETGRYAELQVAEEGLERREAYVARADRVVALPLQSIEEVEDERCGELLDLDAARTHAEALGGEADQELEAVGVALHRVAAGVSIARQVLAQEQAEVNGELSHDETLHAWACSTWRAMWRSRTGVASRYQ